MFKAMQGYLRQGRVSKRGELEVNKCTGRRLETSKVSVEGTTRESGCKRTCLLLLLLTRVLLLIIIIIHMR